MITSPDNQVINEPSNGLLEARFGTSSPSRAALKEIYSPNGVYTFIRTTANPEAVQTLLKYIGKRESMSFPWQTRLKTSRDNLESSDGWSEEWNVLSFSPCLMDTYLATLSKLAKSRLGPRRYASFPLIKTEGVHMMDRTDEFVFWPTIHVIKGRGRVQGFKDLAGNLNNNTAYKIAQAVQGPTAYQMGQVNVLRELRINPILVQERTWEVDGKSLRDAVDFLISFVVRAPETHYPSLDD